MKTYREILKGLLVGSIVSLIALATIHGASAQTNLAKKLSIPALPTSPLTINSSGDEVLALMLESDQKWDSMVATYKLTITDPATNETREEIQNFWLDRKGEFARMELTGINSIVFVRNAASLNHENKNKKIFAQSQIPTTFKYEDFNPRQWLLDNPDVVYLHPYGKALPSGFYDFLYPTAIAQSLITNSANGSETVQILGTEELAGRQAIILSRMPKNHLYWVDATTGVILRAQYFGEADTWQVQYEAQNISFDTKMPASIFQFVPSKNAQMVSPHEFNEQQ